LSEKKRKSFSLFQASDDRGNVNEGLPLARMAIYALTFTVANSIASDRDAGICSNKSVGKL
jgi:hypothetical protein